MASHMSPALALHFWQPLALCLHVVQPSLWSHLCLGALQARHVCIDSNPACGTCRKHSLEFVQEAHLELQHHPMALSSLVAHELIQRVLFIRVLWYVGWGSWVAYCSTPAVLAWACSPITSTLDVLAPSWPFMLHGANKIVCG